MKRLPGLTDEETLQVMAAGRGLCVGAVTRIIDRAREREINPVVDKQRYTDKLSRAANAGKLTKAPTGTRSPYIKDEEQ